MWIVFFAGVFAGWDDKPTLPLHFYCRMLVRFRNSHYHKHLHFHYFPISFVNVKVSLSSVPLCVAVSPHRFLSLCIYIVCTICMNHQTKPASTIDDDDGRTDERIPSVCIPLPKSYPTYDQPNEPTIKCKMTQRDLLFVSVGQSYD